MAERARAARGAGRHHGAGGRSQLLRPHAEGYANSYYAAAVKSMLQSWHNFFFVSFDPGGFVTVDKPPLGFWIQTTSAKLFGFSGFSILLPEALAGVLSVGVLYRLVRRFFGPIAGLLAALFLAITPISVVTNRNNTIDSLLVLCSLAAAWVTLRAAERGQLPLAAAGGGRWSASASTSRCSKPTWSSPPSGGLPLRRAAGLVDAHPAPARRRGDGARRLALVGHSS